MLSNIILKNKQNDIRIVHLNYSYTKGTFNATIINNLYCTRMNYFIYLRMKDISDFIYKKKKSLHFMKTAKVCDYQ